MAKRGRELNTIDVAEVNRALGHSRFGGHVVHLHEVESTNDLALEAAQRGVETGAWVADAQTRGRGRGGHRWHSAPGDGLYVTALCTPQVPAIASYLSLAAGLAAWEAIGEVTGLTIDLRWPNDLVTRTAGPSRAQSRKLGGILVETAVKSPAADPLSDDLRSPPLLRYAVIGLGINVAHTGFPSELAAEATSLRLEGWQAPDRQPLLISLLDKLDLQLRRLEDGYAGAKSASGLLAQFEEASTWLRGKRVRVPEEGGYTGTTAGLTPEGFLLVEDDFGTRNTVRSGGVREL